MFRYKGEPEELNLQVTEKLHQKTDVNETCFSCIRNRLVSNSPRASRALYGF